MKKINEKKDENKENLKLKIQKIFTNIRNEINLREDKLLLEVDKEFEKLYYKEDIIKESEKIPNKIKLSLEKTQTIDKDLEDNNISSTIINDCIYIENTIMEINNIIENIKTCNNSINYQIQFCPEKDNKINYILEKIRNFGHISSNNTLELLIDSIIINKNKLD